MRNSGKNQPIYICLRQAPASDGVAPSEVYSSDWPAHFPEPHKLAHPHPREPGQVSQTWLEELQFCNLATLKLPATVAIILL